MITKKQEEILRKLVRESIKKQIGAGKTIGKKSLKEEDETVIDNPVDEKCADCNKGIKKLKEAGNTDDTAKNLKPTEVLIYKLLKPIAMKNGYDSTQYTKAKIFVTDLINLYDSDIVTAIKYIKAITPLLNKKLGKI